MLNAFARAIGRGLIGGLLGTIAMTATTMLEMRHREISCSSKFNSHMPSPPPPAALLFLPG
jgi:hypothetical protein